MKITPIKTVADYTLTVTEKELREVESLLITVRDFSTQRIKAFPGSLTRVQQETRDLANTYLSYIQEALGESF